MDKFKKNIEWNLMHKLTKLKEGQGKDGKPWLMADLNKMFTLFIKQSHNKFAQKDEWTAYLIPNKWVKEDEAPKPKQESTDEFFEEAPENVPF